MCHEIRHFWSFNDRRDQDDGDMDTDDKDGDTDTEEKRRTGDGSVEEEASVPLDGDSYLPGLTEDEGTPVSFEGKLELWEEKEVEVEVQRRNYPNEINIELEVNNPKSRASEEESQTPLKADNLSENLSGSTTGSLEANLPTLDSASSSNDDGAPQGTITHDSSEEMARGGELSEFEDDNEEFQSAVTDLSPFSDIKNS